MKDQVIHFEVSSLTELREALDKASAEGGSTRFASVRVFGPEILSRQFQMAALPPKDVLEALKLEAVEVFSLAPEEIELSYLVLVASEKQIKGVYVAMPRHRLLDYLDCFKDQPFIPVELTSCAVGAGKDFLKTRTAAGRDFCLVNFLRPQVVNLVVFIDGEPMLLREILYDPDTDLEGKILDSLKYCCSRSARKQFEQIVFTGNTAGHENLMRSLNDFTASGVSAETIEPASGEIRLGKLNLFHGFTLSLQEHRLFSRVIHAALAVAVIFAVVVGLRLGREQAGIEKFRGSFKAAEYERAVTLQEQLKAVGHAQ